jgi:hypothetical protein
LIVLSPVRSDVWAWETVGDLLQLVGGSDSAACAEAVARPRR